MNKQVIKRIATRDMKEISNMNLDEMGIYNRFNEENITEAYALIIGPENTPFENGILFSNKFSSNYPCPLRYRYYSTSKYRIHQIYMLEDVINFRKSVFIDN